MYQCDPIAPIVHDQHMRQTIIAFALTYVSDHFDEFVKDIAKEGKADVLAKSLTKQLYDIWVYPEIRDAVHPRTQFGVMDIGNLGDVLAHLAGQE